MEQLERFKHQEPSYLYLPIRKLDHFKISTRQIMHCLCIRGELFLVSRMYCRFSSRKLCTSIKCNKPGGKINGLHDRELCQLSHMPLVHTIRLCCTSWMQMAGSDLLHAKKHLAHWVITLHQIFYLMLKGLLGNNIHCFKNKNWQHSRYIFCTEIPSDAQFSTFHSLQLKILKVGCQNSSLKAGIRTWCRGENNIEKRLFTNTFGAHGNLGTKKIAALCKFNVLWAYHWGLWAVRAGDCMLDDSFREDAILSRGFFPFEGDLRLTSDAEDLDLPTFNRVRLRELGGLEDGLVSGFVSPSWVSAGACEDRPSPVFPLSPLMSFACPFCLHVLSEAFLTSMVLFPKSADRRLSLWRRALLKKDKPFSSGLLLRCRSLVDTLGERKLVTEELLLELLINLLSGRLLSPILDRGDRATELPRRLSTTGLVCIESLL